MVSSSLSNLPLVVEENKKTPSPCRAGALLRLRHQLCCEPDIYKKAWARFRVFNMQVLPEEVKKAMYLRKGSVVLCVENTLNDNLGVRVMRFMYQEKLYTYIGHYFPEEVFEPVTKDEAFTPVSTEKEDLDVE